MYVLILHWELLSFSLSIFTTDVHLCMPQEPIPNWKCGNENEKKTLKYSHSHTQQRWTMLLSLWRALELLITQLRKTQHRNLRWRSFGLEFKFRFPLTVVAFSRDFPSLLRAGMALSLTRWWTCRNKLVFTQHNRSICLQNVNFSQGLCYAH